jgi:fructose-1,6-bisphosphatase/inositol monophosphatase family enzyme
VLKILGYPDRYSVPQGGEIKFMVSLEEGESFQARLVRVINGDCNPDGPGTHAAVAAPRLGDLYHARSGGGAYKESGGRETPLRVSDTRRLEYAVAGADLSLHGGKPQDPGVERVLYRAWQLRALGSAAIRGAWLAAGYLDVSVGTYNTAWDYAPTVLLVSEAGGRATDLSGDPWSLSSDGLIATNAALYDEVLETLHGA